MCPECGSTNLSCVPYDGKRDPETGYSDTGEIFLCHDCGAQGDARDADVKEEHAKPR